MLKIDLNLSMVDLSELPLGFDSGLSLQLKNGILAFAILLGLV
jgi:hypothetical protein